MRRSTQLPPGDEVGGNDDGHAGEPARAQPWTSTTFVGVQVIEGAAVG